jgi:hypothetical protein
VTSRAMSFHGRKRRKALRRTLVLDFEVYGQIDLEVEYERDGVHHILFTQTSSQKRGVPDFHL